MFSIFSKFRLKNKPTPKERPKVILESAHLAGYAVEIHRKAFRRRLSMQLRSEGKIKVLTNHKVSLKIIEEFIFLKKEWIEKHFQKFAELPQKSELQFKPGEKILYLGELRNLQIQLTPLKTPFFKLQDNNLVLYWPEQAWHQGVCPARANQIWQKYLAKTAQEFLTDRVRFWSDKMNLKPSQLKFRKNKSRWGSCSSRGVVSFNWVLISAPGWVIDSVVVHELAHLKHLNHSAEFWGLVDAYFPEYSKADQWLKRHQNLLA